MRPTSIVIREEPIASALSEHVLISIAFEVRSVFDVGDDRSLVERAVEPWRKDYDLDAQFDLSNWGLLSAWENETRIGGIVIAFDTPGVNMLEGRRDMVVLWDVRVAPEQRGRGAGSQLFRAAEAWARTRNCVRLDVETQNINVPACRFYARMGCELRTHFAYSDLPDEIGLLWTKRL